jgi:hypothetical protein
MAFKSDRQRKAVMAKLNQGSVRSDVKPKVINAKKAKNPYLKLRKIDNPYEIWKSPDKTWEYRVLKKWQIDDNEPYARWYVGAKTPATFGSWEYGDMYVKDIKTSLIKQK